MSSKHNKNQHKHHSERQEHIEQGEHKSHEIVHGVDYNMINPKKSELVSEILDAEANQSNHTINAFNTEANTGDQTQKVNILLKTPLNQNISVATPSKADVQQNVGHNTHNAINNSNAESIAPKSQNTHTINNNLANNQENAHTIKYEASEYENRYTALGYVKIATASPKLRIADIKSNTDEIIKVAGLADKQNATITLFPELSVIGYTAQDLLLQHIVIKESANAIERIKQASLHLNTIVVVGSVLLHNSNLYNCAYVIHNGKIQGIVPKSYLPNYQEFYEKRWFKPGINEKHHLIQSNNNETNSYEPIPFGVDLLFSINSTQGAIFGIELCEDLWAPLPPSTKLALSGANIILNLSASNETVGKSQYRQELIKHQSAKLLCAYAYANAGVGESTTDVVFAGSSYIYECGQLLAKGEEYTIQSTLTYADIDIQKITTDRIKFNTFNANPFQNERLRTIYINNKQLAGTKLDRVYTKTPFIPSDKHELDLHITEIFNIQTHALMTRLMHTGINKVAVNISGGLDSTLALLVCIKTLDMMGLPRNNVHALTLPGFGTTSESYNNAVELMELLSVTIKEISIVKSSLQHFEDIGHDPSVHDVTYENTQARERTKILFNYANKIGALAIGTGDLSELALGWCTYNADHMAMYAVNTSIPKTLVQHVIRYAGNQFKEQSTLSNVLKKILEMPISPELLPHDNDKIVQKTEDIIGPYILHDFFLFHTIRDHFTPSKILALALRTFDKEYSPEFINSTFEKFLKRFISQQFKRSCLPDGPKVGSVSLSPRGDWRMPSDASFALWLEDIKNN